MQYFSTFIPGTRKIIEALLKKRLSNVVIEILSDGIVVYKTNSDLTNVKNLPFFNNTFVLLKKLKINNKDPDNVASKILGQNFRRVPLWKGARDFKIVVSVENEMTSIKSETLNALEKKISKTYSINKTRGSKKPGVEFWINIRSEGYAFFGVRLTYRVIQNRKLEHGELRQEITNMMCFLSKLNSKDVVMDPLSGHGSIPVEVARNFSFKSVLACDIDNRHVNTLKKLAQKYKKMKAWKCNALKLDGIENGSIDKIITDPPWGYYDDYDIEELYNGMIKEFGRILRQNGVVILLTAQQEVLEKTLVEYKKDFAIQDKYNVLISGKKASIYKITRK